MKQILKSISSLSLVLLLALSLSASVFAADSSVTYTGGGNFTFAPGDEHSATSLFTGFNNVMPGDVLEQKITVKNDSSDSEYIRVYMKAVPHDESSNPLATDIKQTETVATITDFLQQLSMTVVNEGTGETIFDASPDQTAGLTDPVFLAKLSQGQSVDLTATLSVPVTLGNEYADRSGEVDWVFVVEELNEPAMELTKTVTSQPKNSKGYMPGETVTYTITVKNTSDCDILNVTVKDDLTGDSWTADLLEAGKSMDFEASYKITEADAAAGSVKNTATASGTPDNPDYPEITAEKAEATVSAIPTPATPAPGQTARPAEGTPRTGDTAPIGAWVMLLAVSAAALVFVFRYRRRTER